MLGISVWSSRCKILGAYWWHGIWLVFIDVLSVFAVAYWMLLQIASSVLPLWAVWICESSTTLYAATRPSKSIIGKHSIITWLKHTSWEKKNWVLYSPVVSSFAHLFWCCMALTSLCQHSSFTTWELLNSTNVGVHTPYRSISRWMSVDCGCPMAI